MRSASAPSLSSRRQTGRVPCAGISSIRCSLSSLPSTLRDALPLSLGPISTVPSSRCAGRGKQHQLGIGEFHRDPPFGERRRLAPSPPKPRSGHEAGGAGARERRLRPRPTQQRPVGSGNPVLSGSSYCWFPAEPSIKRCTHTPAHMGGSPRRYQPGSASRAGNGPLAENGPAQVSETAATWWKVSRPRIPFPRSK